MKLYFKKQLILNLIIYKNMHLSLLLKDVNIRTFLLKKKKLQKEHYNRSLVEKELKEQGIYLSSMKNRKKCTDQCNTSS